VGREGGRDRVLGGSPQLRGHAGRIAMEVAMSAAARGMAETLASPASR
jgi:hypothetical protein